MTDPLWRATSSKILIKAMQEKNELHKVWEELPIFKEFTEEFRSYSPEMKKLLASGSGLSITDAEQRLHDNPKIAESQPSQIHLDEVNTRLKIYYKQLLDIHRVSGVELDLESCYVNLAIVAAPSQRQKDKKELEALKETLHRKPRLEKIDRTNIQVPMFLEELFDRRKLRNGRMDIPKRILVQGRAGIGKTTL
ncbi:hypothetical protein BGX26_001446, partial [Mortierella sp. AD094]